MATVFENAMNQLARAASLKPFSEDLLGRMRTSERDITVSIPVKMDDGRAKFFEGYRVQYSSVRGPYKGGIRFHVATDLDEIKALAFLMTLKTAVANIPMGGGKGGIKVEPKSLSIAELEQLSRGWVRRLLPVLGPDKDVPAPDVNTTPQIMAWMADEYEKLTGDKSGAAFTGKPLSHGGSQGRVKATGLGGFYTLLALRERMVVPPGAKVIIQGMGNVGGTVANIFKENGFTILGMSDSQGGIVNSAGLDPVAVGAYKEEHGSLAGYPDAIAVTNADLLTTQTDLLVPAALENQITKENADKIKAKVVLELANGPTTPEADDILFSKGIFVVPDILANSGGVTVSAFEWEQNIKGEHWSEEEVYEDLKEVMQTEALNVWNRAQELKTDLRRAAFVIALERIQADLQSTA